MEEVEDFLQLLSFLESFFAFISKYLIKAQYFKVFLVLGKKYPLFPPSASATVRMRSVGVDSMRKFCQMASLFLKHINTHIYTERKKIHVPIKLLDVKI